MVEVRALSPSDIDRYLDDVARLRLGVFGDWPYLYDGALDYERAYVRSYRDTPGALMVGAFEGGVLVGVSTSSLMDDHAEGFAQALQQIGLPAHQILYGPESVLLKAYRGQGLGHRFFDLREAHARALKRSHVVFCSVVRPADDPQRPEGFRSNDAFWQGRGYAALPGVTARFSWRDRGAAMDSEKTLQFWMREIEDL